MSVFFMFRFFALFGKHEHCTLGWGEWPNLGGLAHYHMQKSPTCWDPYLSLPVLGKNRNAQLSLYQQQ